MNNSDMPAMPMVNKYGHPSNAGDNTLLRKGQCIGLTRREHFAVTLYAGMISATDQDGEWTGINCADEAVNQADALLAALEQQK